MKYPAIGLIEGMILELALEETKERHFYLTAKNDDLNYLIQVITTEGIIDLDYLIIN